MSSAENFTQSAISIKVLSRTEAEVLRKIEADNILNYYYFFFLE